MDNEIQLISDGDGLAVIGDPTTVERFLVSEGLSSKALELPRLRSALGTGAAATRAGSEIAANSGRWVKLTEESATLVKKHGLRKSSKSGLSTGVVKGSKGQVKGFVEFVKTPGSLLTNPALLAGAAGVMAQVAMQQTMDEIADYLATIDEKVDDVLRAQKDAVLARMIGVGFVIDEAMTVREHGGRVNEVTWSHRTKVDRRCRRRRRRSQKLRRTRCVSSTHSRRRWSARPRCVISPRRPRKPSPAFGNGWLFWLAASN